MTGKMAHDFHPSTQEKGRQTPVILRAALGQFQEVHSETLSLSEGGKGIAE